MRVHHVRAALLHQGGQRTDHPRVGDGRVVRLLRVGVKRVEYPAPPGDAMHRDAPVEFGPGAALPAKRDNFDFVTAANELVSQQLDVQIAPAYEGWGGAVRGLKDAHQPVTSSRRFLRNEMWLAVCKVEHHE